MKRRFYCFILLALVILMLAGCPFKPGEKEVVVVFTVTFDKNHDDETGFTEAIPQTMQVADGKTVDSLPLEPTREAYLFDCWRMETGQELTEETVVTRDITVYAQWQIKTYVVCFHPNGGHPVYVLCIYGIKHGSTVPGLSDYPLTKEGYELVGWNTEPDGSGEDYAEDTVVTSNITFYAQWVREACGVERFSATNLNPDEYDGEQVFSFVLIGSFIVGEVIELRIEDGKEIRWVDFEVNHTDITIKEDGDWVGDRLTNPTITLIANEIIPDGTTISVSCAHVDTSNEKGEFGDPVSDVTVEVIIERFDCDTKKTTTFDVLALFR